MIRTSAHEISNIERTFINLGRELITKCETNEIFPEDNEETLTLWNAAVTAGNKFVTYGMTWSKFKGMDDLTELEKSAVRIYLDLKHESGS